jgi:hypothetical protein
MLSEDKLEFNLVIGNSFHLEFSLVIGNGFHFNLWIREIERQSVQTIALEEMGSERASAGLDEPGVQSTQASTCSSRTFCVLLRLVLCNVFMGDLERVLFLYLTVMLAFFIYLNCITNHLLKYKLFRRSSSRSLPPDFPPSRHRAVLFFRGAAHPFSFSTSPAAPSHHHRVAVGRVRLLGRDRRFRARVPSFLFSYFVQIHFISLF